MILYYIIYRGKGGVDCYERIDVEVKLRELKISCLGKDLYYGLQGKANIIRDI